jgi:alkylation response protein AidB-like acyl-CoA dehydrogenase
VQIGQVFDTTGHRGSQISEVVFEDARIPAEALIGEEGQGMEYAKRCLSEGRTTLSARCVGSAQKAMELAVEYAEQRRTFGKPLIEHQALAFRMAQMSARTEAARLVVYRSAWILDQGGQAIRESSTAKYLPRKGAWQTVDDAMQIFGGYGYIHKEYMIERIWRDLRVARVYDGSSEVQQIVIRRPPAQGRPYKPSGGKRPARAPRSSVPPLVTRGRRGLLRRAPPLSILARGATSAARAAV